MGIPVLILGESGSGKSAALRNFAPDEAVIFNIASKPLPFRKKMGKIANAPTYAQITNSLKKRTSKIYVIDDSQYLMAFSLFDKANETGYKKFTDIAVDFRNLINFVVNGTSSDTIVYFLHHVQTDDNGKVKAKTVGKMLDTQLTIEGLFSIVLYCTVIQGRHVFITQSDGTTTAKSPMEMFPFEIENDLKAVDSEIRNYYELKEKDI